MRTNNFKSMRIALFGLIFGMVGAMAISAQLPTANVPDGSKLTMKGIIAVRSPDSFVMRDISNTTLYIVQMTGDTEVKTHRKGVFRGGKEYPESYLLRGLRVEVDGHGNGDGHLVASRIRFEEDDLRTAQALQTTLDPVEGQVKDNAANIAANKERIAAGEENAKKMSAQIDENTAMSAEAMAQANRANNRINGLDEFEVIKTITVPFATGRFTLGPQGKKIIDEAAAWAKTQDRKGWMVEIVGYADSSGNSASNRTLSEKRASTVIGYLVGTYNMQLSRLVQPFGAGVDRPVAPNETAAGRAQNRRVEIRLLLNKGIAG